MKRKILALVMDLAVAAALLGGIYGVNYMIPQKGVTAQTLQASASGNEAAEAAENTGNSSGAASGEQNNAAGQSSREQQLQALLDGNRNGLPATKVSLDSTDCYHGGSDMKIMEAIRKAAAHICIICSIVLLVIQILDWYNPFMDFMGHSLIVLYALLISASWLGAYEIYGRNRKRRLR